MNKLLKMSIIVLTALSVVLSIEIGLFEYLVFIVSDHKIIKNFESINKEFYSIDNRKIRNDVNENYIFTTDKVFYLFTINSKISDYSTIKYDFNVISAGESVKHDSAEYNLGGNGNNREFFFYPKNSGTYEIHVKMNFYNDTDTNPSKDPYAQEVHTIDKIQVWDLSDKLQLDANENSRNLAIVSIIIAGAAVLITGYQTKKLRDERDLTIRAWVSNTGSQITIANVFNDKNEFKTYDDWAKLTDSEKTVFGEVGIELHIILKNFGSIPAVDIRSRLYCHPNREPTQQELNSIEFGDPFVIMPQNESITRFFLPKNIAVYFLNPTILSYLSLEIAYRSSNSTKQRIFGVTFVRKTSGFSVTKTWDEKSITKDQVDEAKPKPDDNN